MNTSIRTSRSPLLFISLVFAISVPFWLIGPLIERLLPQDRAINLPVSALMAVNPMIVALILVYRENGIDGVKALLKHSFDYRRIKKKWYLPIFLFMPLAMLLAYGLMKLMGRSIPDPRVPVEIAPILFIVFFIAASAEEVGWQGYAFDPLEDRWNALGASLILGIVWAVWHAIPYIQTHNTATWIIWQGATSFGLRILIAWVYNNNGKSVLAAILFHDMVNVSEFLFPNYGSYYDPFIATIIITVAAAAVVALWGPKTLAQSRNPLNAR